MAHQQADLLGAKRHFEILDGLRGIAAVAVVIFHFMEIVFADYRDSFIAHGFLAVDFFFCLSGFVIAYAYDDRIGKMGPKEFFKSRLIRLHPLVVLGSLIGLLGFLLHPFAEPPAYGVGYTLLLFAFSLLLIPFPFMPERLDNLFNLNAPSWSLFWEYLANILYAAFVYRVGRRYLLGFAVVAAAVLSVICYYRGALTGGWGGPTFWDGAVRVAFSFTAGLVTFRYNWIIPNKLGFPGVALLLIPVFLIPYGSWNWLVEPLVVILYFPFLIALGAGATLSQGFRKICVFSGLISYPLYMIHYESIWVFWNYLKMYKPEKSEIAMVITIGTVVLVALAYLVLKFYDIPVRRYLSQKRKPVIS